MFKRLLFCLMFSAFGNFCLCAAQTYTVEKIVFSQRGTFTQQQLEDAAGLHRGLTLTATQLGEAAQRLVKTGYFDQVDATLDGKISAVTVLFDDKPTPLAAMLHVAFENFVWLSPDEIESAIRAAVPLFNGYLPDNSPHQVDIANVLTAALTAKSVAAKVAYGTYEPTLYHPLREIAFRVDSPFIEVGSIKLAGVTPALAPLVQSSVNATARTAYTQGPADRTTAESILAPLLDSGYVTATLGNVTLTPVTTPRGGIDVGIAATLIAGDVYHVSEFSYAGTSILSADDFRATSKVHAGDVASHKAVLASLMPLDAAYRRLGYMDVVIRTNPKLDPGSHVVTYAVTVDPGEQYRIHEVITNNLDAAAKADFAKAFLLKPGTLYTPEYVNAFLKNNNAIKSLEGYSAAYKAYADPGAHTVDLVITFARGGRE